MGVSSPFFQQLNLEKYGLKWTQPELALAHPLDNGDAAAVGGKFDDAIYEFGADADAVRNLIGPLAKSWQDFCGDVLRPLGFPKHPFLMARFGLNAIQPVARIARKLKTEKARAALAGNAGHSIRPLESWASGAFGILFWASCYAVGWPFAAGGSQSIADALAKALKEAGGEIVCGQRIESLDELPKARAILCDLTPRQVLNLAGNRLASSEKQRFTKYRYGPGVFKMDWALDGPIPWTSPICKKAGTVHVGGTFEEIARSERAAWNGEHVDKPFVLLTQPSIFDPSRAPARKHTAWAYCHVPNGSTVNMQDRIEAQVERFAKGFRDRIIGRSAMNTTEMERHNANLVGGDVGAGSLDLNQLFIQPTRRHYSTSIPNVFICSASTPPGPGVHGMCGHLAAKEALKKCF
jgi:phytoene dehydrogenase-like protein